MEEYLKTLLKGIRQWAAKFWEKDETTYSEFGFYNSGTLATGKTIVTPLNGNLKKVTLVINSCVTRNEWIDMYWRLPYIPNIRFENITTFGYYNGTDFRVTLTTKEGQPVFCVNHLIAQDGYYIVAPWNGETIAFVLEYYTITNN